MIGCWCLVVGVWLFCCLVVLLSVWKTVPSAARVTWDEVSGYSRCARYWLPAKAINNKTTRQQDNLLIFP